MLMCGQPFSAGQSHLAFAPGADRVHVLQRLDEALEQLARREGAGLIVFKEFGEVDRAAMDALQDRDYQRADSPPMYHLAKPFESFDDYRAALKSHYRTKVRRTERRFAEAGCRFVHYHDLADIATVYTPAAHQMYEAVAEKSDLKLEVLSREFFLGLVQQLPGRVFLAAAYRGDRLIGFAWNLVDDHAFHGLFLGMDYTQTGETDLYFNLVYESLDAAFRVGAAIVEIGQTADAFKTLLGCTGTPRYFYARGIGRLKSWLLRRFAAKLFPPREPHPAHDVFKEEPTMPQKTKEPRKVAARNPLAA
jgi:predicted N-acyltransferase